MRNILVYIVLIHIIIITSLSFPYEQIDSIIEITLDNPYDISLIRQMGADIDNVYDDKVRAYVPRDTVSQYKNAGFVVNVLYEDSREICNWVEVDPDMEKKNGRDISFDNYHSPTALYDALVDINTNYPDITELYQVGTSVEERELWAIKITDNPNTEETEPEYRLIGLHHGDEWISVEVALYVADYLTRNYASDPFCQHLVDEREIWVFPMMNPDGWVHNRRRNQNNVDLNRNYSYMWDDDYEWYAGEYPFSEPETRAVRNFSEGGYDYPNTFVYAITGHSGAQCYNYPWNWDYEDNWPYEPNPTPDEDMLSDFGDYYQHLNTTSGFWVTNGADWYPTWGDCNDWSYGERSCIDITLEISDIKTPPTNQIITYCEDNLYAILSTISLSGGGIWGVVTDADTGQPIPASIDIAGIDWTYYNDPFMGDYHRMLQDGTYDITCASDGYISETVEGVEVALYDGDYSNWPPYPPYDAMVYATRVDFQLEVDETGIDDDEQDSDDESSEEGVLAMSVIPNPVYEHNGSIILNIPEETQGMVDLSVYDISGRKVGNLLKGNLPPGEHSINIEDNVSLSSGVYIALLRLDNDTLTKSFVIAR